MVSLVQIKSMEEPYGLCDPEHNTPMSDCRVDCRTREIVSVCGCGDVYMSYMKNDTDTPVCNLTDAFGCVRWEMERLQKRESNCSCSVPCTRVVYEPALSYAHLSKFSIERLVLTNPERKEKVREQYRMATEMFQREDAATWMSDTVAIRAVQRGIDSLEKSVDDAVASLDAGAVENLILRLKQAIEDDYDYLGFHVAGQITGIRIYLAIQFYQYMRSYEKIISYMAGLPGFMSNIETIQDYLGECVRIDPSPIDFTNEEWKNEKDDDSMADYIDPQNVSSLIPECTALADTLDTIFQIPNNYYSAISALYNNTGGDPDIVPKHRNCLDALRQLEGNFESATKNLTGLMRAMFEEPEREDLWDVAEQVVDVLRNSEVAQYMDVYWNLEVCMWIRESMSNEEDSASVVVGIFNAISAIPSLKAAFTDYKKHINTMKNLLTNNLNSSLVAMDGYVRGTTTKLDMAKVFNSIAVNKGLEELVMTDMYLCTVNREVKDILATISQNLKGCFEITFEMTIPMLNDERIARLNFTHFALSLGSQRINDLYANMSQDRRGNLLKLVDETTNAIHTPLNMIAAEISILTSEAGDKMNDYVEVLDAYQQENRMNQDFFMQNFLQVDIFYRELNTEKISQRESFAVASLLGEVGGFLGLLLGASVLTVCELIDHLTMSCLEKMRAEKKAGNAK